MQLPSAFEWIHNGRIERTLVWYVSTAMLQLPYCCTCLLLTDSPLVACPPVASGWVPRQLLGLKVTAAAGGVVKLLLLLLLLSTLLQLVLSFGPVEQKPATVVALLLHHRWSFRDAAGPISATVQRQSPFWPVLHRLYMVSSLPRQLLFAEQYVAHL
jgi:hypothetical protein